MSLRLFESELEYGQLDYDIQMHREFMQLYRQLVYNNLDQTFSDYQTFNDDDDLGSHTINNSSTTTSDDLGSHTINNSSTTTSCSTLSIQLTSYINSNNESSNNDSSIQNSHENTHKNTNVSSDKNTNESSKEINYSNSLLALQNEQSDESQEMLTMIYLALKQDRLQNQHQQAQLQQQQTLDQLLKYQQLQLASTSIQRDMAQQSMSDLFSSDQEHLHIQQNLMEYSDLLLEKEQLEQMQNNFSKLPIQKLLSSIF